MRAGQTIARLLEFTGRGPGTDAERRAALWLAAQLREAGFEPRIETFWCRPNWALAHAWHVALALAGSLVAVHAPRVGLTLVLVALGSIWLDAWRGVSLGRWLTPQRASQNVVVSDARTPDRTAVPTRLIIVANYDVGRGGLIYAAPASAVRAALRRATGGRAPGWLAWLSLALMWIAITAALRVHGVSDAAVGPLAVVPSAALVVGLALLLEAATAPPGPGAGDNGSGTAVSLSLFTALRASPPRDLAVEIVLCGAHEGGAIGLDRHLRAHRVNREDTVLLGLAACGAGDPAWWRSDGPLLPRRAAASVARLAGELAERYPAFGLRMYRGRGWSPAYPAYARRLPAITLGALGPRGLVPRSHRHDDVAEAIDPRTNARVLELGLLFADALNARAGARGRAHEAAATALATSRAGR